MNLVMLIKYGCATLILKSWFINEEFGKSQTRLLSVITHLNAWLCFCHFSFKDKWQSQIFCYFGTKAKNFTRAHWKNVKSTYDSSANDEAVDQISKYLSTINWLYLDIKQIKKKHFKTDISLHQCFAHCFLISTNPYAVGDDDWCQDHMELWIQDRFWDSLTSHRHLTFFKDKMRKGTSCSPVVFAGLHKWPHVRSLWWEKMSGLKKKPQKNTTLKRGNEDMKENWGIVYLRAVFIRHATWNLHQPFLTTDINYINISKGVFQHMSAVVKTAFVSWCQADITLQSRHRILLKI